MRSMIKSKWFFALAMLATVAVINAPTDARAGAGAISWTGQGVECDEFGICVLKDELCGVANGADVDGPYLLWVLTGQNITGATITISGCGTEVGGTMTQGGNNGSWKYISDYCDPTKVQASVTYNYTGRAPANPQLVISHGCKPAEESANIWCSPGYWKNNSEPWALTGYSPTDDYNSTSCGMTNPVSGNPTLLQVVSSPQTYGGAAVNCVGQLLTNTLCGGGQLNPDCPNSDSSICPDNCPFDSHGNVKDDAPAICQAD
jgi:hypothetical protein